MPHRLWCKGILSADFIFCQNLTAIDRRASIRNAALAPGTFLKLPLPAETAKACANHHSGNRQIPAEIHSKMR
jgi:hypothetical protein